LRASLDLETVTSSRQSQEAKSPEQPSSPDDIEYEAEMEYDAQNMVGKAMTTAAILLFMNLWEIIEARHGNLMQSRLKSSRAAPEDIMKIHLVPYSPREHSHYRGIWILARWPEVMFIKATATFILLESMWGSQ